MNDEFLYRLRKEPPPEFAQRLKERLHRQGAGSPPRLSLVRVLAAAALIGGSVWAAALLSTRGVPSMVRDLFGDSNPSLITPDVPSDSQSTVPDDSRVPSIEQSSGVPARNRPQSVAEDAPEVQFSNEQEMTPPQSGESDVPTPTSLSPGSAAALSQNRRNPYQEAVNYRKALMTVTAGSAEQLAMAARGQLLYDAAVATASAERVALLANMLPDAFVLNTSGVTVEDTESSPKIWKEKSEFDLLARELANKAGAAVAAIRSGDQVKAKDSFDDMNSVCGTCHDKYRVTFN